MYDLSKTIKSYDNSTKWHSAKFDGYDMGDYLTKFIKLLRGKKVLDFGCGNGRDSDFFDKKGLNITGIDYSDELIKIAKIRVKNAKILKMDFLKNLEFKDKCFDGVRASASLLHVPKEVVIRVLKEINRVLKIHGVLFISVKEGEGEKIVQDDYGNEDRFFSFFKTKELTGILNKSGFKVLTYELISDDKTRVYFVKKKRKQKWIMIYSIKK